MLVETTSQPPASDHDQGAVHFYTSGTDGRPKGVVTHEAVTGAGGVDGRLPPGHGPGCAVLCALPVTHGYGYTAGLFAPLSFGGTAIVARPRLAASLAKLLLEHDPRSSWRFPPSMPPGRALREPYTGPCRGCGCVAGRRCPRRYGPVHRPPGEVVIAEQYGHDRVWRGVRRPGRHRAAGRPYPGVTVSIDGGDASAEVGEVVVDTPYGPRGYLGDPTDGRASPFTAEWLPDRRHAAGSTPTAACTSSDVEHISSTCMGRRSIPSEVERAFWAVDGVRDVAVIGVDRAEGDQWIAAFVVCEDSITDDALHRATANLESFKRPQRLTRLPRSRRPPRQDRPRRPSCALFATGQ